MERAAEHAVYLLDPEGRVQSWNQGAARITGHPAEAVLGGTDERLYPAAARDRGEPRWGLNVASAEGRYSEEGWLLRHDGSRFWADLVVSALRDEAGTLLGFAKIIRDRTRQHEHEERFRVAVEAAPNALVMVGADGVILLVNRQTERLFGYGREELVGRSVEVLVPERFRAHHPASRRRFGASPQARPMGAGRDLFGLRKDGTEVPVEIGLNPIRMEQGEFVLAAIVDITERIAERRHAEEAVRQVNASLEQRVADRTAELHGTLQELERFSYTVAHDLRAPLRAIHRYAELVGEDPAVSQAARSHLARIRDGAARMDRLTEDLLAYSRVSRAELSLEPLDVHTLIQDILGSLEQQVAEAKADLEVAPELPKVRADRFLLGQALTNLLGNALKFTRPGERPRVRMGAEAFEGGVRLWVEDEGVGVDARFRDKIWEIFERVPTGGENTGTGIGLAIVEKAVDRMGGRVGLDSELGRGSRFWIELPA